MSDGLDPRHGPYRGAKGPAIDLDHWCFQVVRALVQKGCLVPDVPTEKAFDEVRLLAVQVVRATRDGHFTEIPQHEIPEKAVEAWTRGDQGIAYGFVCSHPRRIGNLRSGFRSGCGSCDRCLELARHVKGVG